MAMRAAVAGAIAAQPIGSGGLTWAFLNYLLGFRALGWEVLYVEELDASRCIDRDWRRAPFAVSANVALLESVLARHGLDGALLYASGDEYAGWSPAAVHDWIAGADVFVNLSGRFHRHDLMRAARRRVYVDLDPGFTQIWQAGYGADMNLDGHDVYVTVGLNLGAPGCPLPTAGREWHPLPPPVAIDAWATGAAPGPEWTTVADWRGYPPVQWQGHWYGQKREEFLRCLDLPARVSVPLRVCLAIHPDEPDLPRLRASGWHLSDPRVCAADSEAYRHFVRASRGEWSVAKHGYVAGRSGWVSDRTACYLAAGRPVVVQDTGLAGHLPLGQGLLGFGDAAAAAAAIASVERDYATHAAAAAALAAEYFDARRVLTRLLELAG